MTSEELQAVRQERHHFQTTLDAYTLGQILDDARVFSMNAEDIKPEVVAHCNRILGKLGALDSLTRLAQAFMDVAGGNTLEDMDVDEE